MTKEYDYSEGSWEAITRAVKQSLGIEVLTEVQAKAILARYIKGTPVQTIIEELEKK